MVKLKMRLEQPVQAGVELLLLADNYIALWLAVTRERVFAITLADRIPGPGAGDAAELSEVLARSVIIPAEPSVAIAELIRIKGRTDLVPAAPVTLVRDLWDAGPDDVTCWLFVAQSEDGASRQSVAAWMHTGVAVDVLDPAGWPRDGLVDYWVQRGLRRGGPEDLLHAADRWSATFDRGNGTLVVTAADGELALTGSYNPVRDRDWLDAIEHTGKLVVLVGRLADDGGDITTESLQTAAGAGGIARGVVRVIDR